MGYESYEQPMISAIIYYYDKGNCATLQFSERLLLSLEKCGYNDITNIELGKHELVDGVLRDFAIRHSKKELSAINLKSELLKWVNDDTITYISFIHKEKRNWKWDVTWYKNYRMPDNISVNDYTFNHLSIVSSYESLNSKDKENEFVRLFCNLADLFCAFYGRIEDVSTAVEMLEHTKEKVFNPKYLQTVYWGNYLGRDYCLGIGQEKLIKSSFAVKKLCNETAFLAVTDSLFDSKDNCDFRQRKKLLRSLTR